MKKITQNTFDPIVMSPQCQQRIEDAMQSAPKRSKPVLHLRPVAITACLILILLAAFNPFTVKATERAIQSLVDLLNHPGTQVSYESPDGMLNIDLHVKDGVVISDSGPHYLTGAPYYLSEADGRLYFVANLEHIDITEMISEEIPFTYIYMDPDGFTHYIAVGGTYSPDPDINDVGYGEWISYVENAEQTKYGKGWMGGYCDHHWDPETGEDRKWLQVAKDEMGIPW